jgi:hypothetical protein
VIGPGRHVVLDKREVVASANSIVVRAMTGLGASRPLRRIPAIVCFLNQQPALSLVGGNRSSCPIAAIA